MLAADKPPLGDVYLEHYGVKGMKWGVKNAAKALSPTQGVGAKAGVKIGQKINAFRNDPDASGVSRRQARQAIKTSNRNTSRNLQDFERASNRSEIIRTARKNRVDTQRKYEDFKSGLKNQKSTGAIGKNQARVLLNEAKNERYANVYKSEQKTAGEQFLESLFAPRAA